MNAHGFMRIAAVSTLGAAALTIGSAHVGNDAIAKATRSGVRSAVMTKVNLKDARHPQAICNDGTSAAMYVQAGHGDDANKWILFFQGGAGCATDHDCLARAKEDHQLISSSDLTATKTGDGILSTARSVNPDFADFTHVLVHYCSSDVYAGDGERKIGNSTWQFRGHRIVDAIIDELGARSIEGAPLLADAKEVIVAGSSAGGMGVDNNVDHIAERLSQARVVGISDSAWAPIMKPLGPGSLQVRPDTPGAFAYTHAVADESCAAANPKDPGSCLAASVVYPYLSAPTFFYAEQRDPVHLGTYGIVGPPKSTAERQFVLEYGKLLRQQVREEQVPAYFLADVGKHTALTNDRFNSVTIDGQSLSETIGDWYFGRPGELQLIQKPQGGGAQTARRPRR